MQSVDPMSTENLPQIPQNLELQVDSTDSFDVREFKVNEGVNTLFSVDLLVRCSNPAVDFEATVGTPSGPVASKLRVGCRLRQRCWLRQRFVRVV